jgi:hypothetical protein
MWLGHARARGAKRIWAIGAYGSNHAIATVLHAPAAGLEAGAILFPQPTSDWAVENCGALIASGVPLVCVPSVALMPFAALRIARRERDAIVMPPGGATPTGTIGALSGALELATQIEEGRAPAPKRIVVGVGSTCTISGLSRLRSRMRSACGYARPDRAWRSGDAVAGHLVTLIADLARRTRSRIERRGRVTPTGAKVRGPSSTAADRSGYGRVTKRGDEATRTLVGVGPRLDGGTPRRPPQACCCTQRRRTAAVLGEQVAGALAAPAEDKLRAAHGAAALASRLSPVLRRWLRG